jgi:transposase
MRKRKGEELLRLVVDNKCVPLTRGPARRGDDTNTCRARGASVEQMCAFLGLKKTLVYEVLKRHREGEPLEQRNPSKRARIRGPQLQAIQNFVSYDETLFLAELQTKLRLVFGESYSPSLICRALKLLGLRRKKVSTGVTCPLILRLSHSLALLCSVTAEQLSGTRPSAWSSHAAAARTSGWTSACFEGVYVLGLCDRVLRRRAALRERSQQQPVGLLPQPVRTVRSSRRSSSRSAACGARGGPVAAAPPLRDCSAKALLC